MNILFLGNGFDLANYLPTKYNNFLHVVDYIIENDNPSFKTIGNIMSAAEWHSEDEFISKCYTEHKNAYDNIAADDNRISELRDRAKNNYWFKYLSKSFNKDVGWIDFEKEISTVIGCFESLFKDISVKFSERIFKEPVTKYIIEEFAFFYIKEDKHHVQTGIVPTNYTIKNEYIFEYPLGSGITKVDTEKIIDFLYIQLRELADLLKLYLILFVESVLDYYKKPLDQDVNEIFAHTDCAISLNYTSTFKNQYPATKIYHIHGDINGNIVLGVNPNENDRIETINTSFVGFKKYSQRVLYDIDNEYVRWLQDVKWKGDLFPREHHLLVMGHSLDVTDEDVISQLFDISQDITILYLDDEKKFDYIRNLVRIFGKEKFESLRYEQKLTFMPLNGDFKAFLNERYKTSKAGIEARCRVESQGEKIEPI